MALHPRFTRQLPAFFRNAAGWLLIGCLWGAPLTYGTTRWWTENLLAEILLVTFCVWLFSLPGQRGWRRPGWIELAIFYLLLSGWWMALNSSGLYDPAYRSFLYLEAPVPFAPGSVDKLGSWTSMERISGLFAAFFIARSLSSDLVWRKRFWISLTGTGLLVAVIGLAFKIGGPRLMAVVWEPEKISNTNFALFRYHANAGAFLNLTWPLALGLCIPAFAQRLSGKGKWFWLAASLIILIGVQINISKGSVAIAVLLALLFAGAWVALTSPGSRHRGIMGCILLLALCAVLAAAVAPFTRYTNGWARWKNVEKERVESIDWRLDLQELSFHMARDAGWLGFGPGTFEAAFVKYQNAAHKPPGLFEDAHEDYLQTVIEWGWIGTVAWSVILLTGLRKLSHRMVIAWQSGPLESFWLDYAILIALLGVLTHAGFDFPLQIDSIRLYVFTLLAMAWSFPEREIPLPPTCASLSRESSKISKPACSPGRL